MKQSPSWDANGHAATQELPNILCNQKSHYRVHKSQPLVSIVSQLNLVQHPPPPPNPMSL
jgi:hypothetical protein